MHPVGIDEQPDGQRQRAERELTDGNEGPAGVAAGNRRGVTGCGRRHRHVQRRVVGLRDGQPTQHAEKHGKAPRAPFVNALPPLGGIEIFSLLIFPVQQRGGDTQRADRHQADRIDHQPITADPQRDGDADDRATDRAENHRDQRPEQRLDQRGANLRRELCVGAERLDKALDQHVVFAAPPMQRCYRSIFNARQMAAAFGARDERVANGTDMPLTRLFQNWTWRRNSVVRKPRLSNCGVRAAKEFLS